MVLYEMFSQPYSILYEHVLRCGAVYYPLLYYFTRRIDTRAFDVLGFDAIVGRLLSFFRAIHIWRQQPMGGRDGSANADFFLLRGVGGFCNI